jgi:SAM-dependent methyltransferase
VRPGTAVRLLYVSLRSRGVRGTLHRTHRLAATRGEQRRRAREDRRFDERRGVDTAKWVRVPELGAENDHLDQAIRYQPSSVEEFRLRMARLGSHVDVSDFTFVDYGSGKGRVLLLAAELPFRRIVGVEFSRSLHEVALRNIATLGRDAARVEAIHDDATSFEPPAGPLVLYFFHPFGAPVLREVLGCVRASIERVPRPVYVVLTGPTDLAREIEDAGFEKVDVDDLGWHTRGVYALSVALSSPRPHAA